MKDAIKLITQILFFYAITFMAVEAYGDERQMTVYGAWIIILTLYCYWQRQRAGRLAFFICSHIVVSVVAAAVIWGGNFPKGMVALTILMVICSMLVRCFPEVRRMEEPGYFQLVILALAFFQSRYWGKVQGAQQIVFAVFCVMLLLMVWHDNLKAADIFIRDRKSSTRMDEKKLKRCNYLFSFLYSGVLFLVLLLAGGIHTDGISRFLGRLISMLLGRIPKGKMLQPEPEEKVVMEFAGGEPSLFLKILILILKIVFSVGLLAGVLYFLFWAVKSISKRRFQTKNMGDIEEYAEPLTVSKKISHRKTKSFFKAVHQPPAWRVRRIYRKDFYKVFRKKGKELQYLSPEEQIAALDMTGEKAEELLALYEKARYSRDEVTEGDVRRMKELTSCLFYRYKEKEKKADIFKK